jgi:hypothetical protein
MAKVRKPIPKTQTELSQNTVNPYDSRGKASTETSQQSRANRRSVSNSDVKQLSIGLKDIDTAIEYYFINVIKPSVRQNGTQLTVPIIYGNQERWTAVQKDGYYRDKNGKIQTPLIMYKRDSIEKNRNLGNKMTANNPLHYGVFEKRYSSKNVYDRFSVLQNRAPVREFYGVIMPDYVNIAYSCVIFTEYIEQMNKIVEAINFASDSYWGNKAQFQFRAMIDTYTPTVELVQGQDRVVKTTFTINLLGYIIPDAINTTIANPSRFFSKAAVNFKLETAGTLEQLTSRAATPERAAASRFFETPNLTIIMKDPDSGVRLAEHIQSVPSNEWIFDHGLDYRYPVITVYAEYDGELKLIIPVKTLVVSENVLKLVMPGTFAGYATAVARGEAAPPALSNEDKEYILLNTVLDSNLDAYQIEDNGFRVRFTNVQIITPPIGYPSLTISNFNVFINGMSIEPSAIASIVQDGTDLLISFNSTLDYAIDSEKEIIVSGKLRKL